MFPFLTTQRPLRTILRSAILCGVMTVITGFPAASAEDDRVLIRIEEDWVALVRNTDSGNTTPQIVNIISPGGDQASVIGIVELNHSSQPSFIAGGFQVQAWKGDTLTASARGSEHRSLYQSMDRLEYTITMEKTDDGIEFGIQDGRSKSWGRFAQQGQTASLTASGISLDGYRPEDSVASSNVNCGAHRIEVLYQKAVRRYYSDRSEETDSTMRVVHRFQELVEVVSLEEYERNADFYNIDVTE